MSDRRRGSYAQRANTTTKATIVNTTATRAMTVKMEDRRLGLAAGFGAASFEVGLERGGAI
jgi:hypothetical protein